jgi:hypothetical protein
MGWSIAIDPGDEAVFARWEQLNRSMQTGPRWKW